MQLCARYAMPGTDVCYALLRHALYCPMLWCDRTQQKRSSGTAVLGKQRFAFDFAPYLTTEPPIESAPGARER
eukprot:2567730-Rhodomonas_salina.1